jgi:chromosome partitioning protein
MIITVQNQKGGVGKTTLAVNISYILSLKQRVLLLDSDPQGSARDWAAARNGQPPFAVIALDRPTIHRDLPAMASDYDHVIAADLIVIPVQPSPYDVWAAQEVLNLIQEASLFKETLKSLFVINRKIVNTAIGRDVVTALTGLGTAVAKSQICQRVAFAESAATGQTVLETEPKGQAAKEIKALVKELLSYA